MCVQVQTFPIHSPSLPSIHSLKRTVVIWENVGLYTKFGNLQEARLAFTTNRFTAKTRTNRPQTARQSNTGEDIDKVSKMYLI